MQHVRLLIQRSQIGSTGNVCACYACPVIDRKCCRIVCNAGSQNRDLIGSCRCCLQRGRCICQNQVNIRRYKLVDDRCTGCGITGSILQVKLHIFLTQQFCQCILKALGCCIQRFVLYQLTDTNVIHLAICCYRIRCCICCLLCCCCRGFCRFTFCRCCSVCCRAAASQRCRGHCQHKGNCR